MRDQGRHRRRDDDGTDNDNSGSQLLPAADPGLTDAEKFSTEEGRTEEDLDP